MTQHVNRVAAMLPDENPAMNDYVHRVVRQALRAGCADQVRWFIETHPGEQPWMVFMDLRHPRTQMMEHAMPEMFAGANDARAAAASNGLVPLWWHVCGWERAAHVVEWLTDGSRDARAQMDILRGEGVMAVTLTKLGLSIGGPVQLADAPADAERERRRQRARRRHA